MSGGPRTSGATPGGLKHLRPILCLKLGSRHFGTFLGGIVRAGRLFQLQTSRHSQQRPKAARRTHDAYCTHI